jgi:urease accessory protein
MLSLGRPVIDERFGAGRALIGLRLSRDGRPLLHERLRLGAADRNTGSQSDTDGAAGSRFGTGSIIQSETATGAALEGASSLRGWPISATLLAVGAGAEDLKAARAALPAAADFPVGLTRVDDLLVARALAHKVEPVLLAFRALWEVLRPRLLGLDASAPRIWAT